MIKVFNAVLICIIVVGGPSIIIDIKGIELPPYIWFLWGGLTVGVAVRVGLKVAGIG